MLVGRLILAASTFYKSHLGLYSTHPFNCTLHMICTLFQTSLIVEILSEMSSEDYFYCHAICKSTIISLRRYGISYGKSILVK